MTAHFNAINLQLNHGKLSSLYFICDAKSLSFSLSLSLSFGLFNFFHSPSLTFGIFSLRLFFLLLFFGVFLSFSVHAARVLGQPRRSPINHEHSPRIDSDPNGQFIVLHAHHTLVYLVPFFPFLFFSFPFSPSLYPSLSTLDLSLSYHP